MERKSKQYCYVRESLHFTERGPYKLIHISPKGKVFFEKEDGEWYNRDLHEVRIASKG